MTDTALVYSGIAEVAQLFRKRKLSPVELTKIILARIEQLNPKLNVYITVTSELALARAKKAEAELFAPRGHKRRDRGPLHGIPISLKDNIYTAGVRTTAGSTILRHFVPRHDARVVTQLYEAGAVLVGKTNLHEFAYGVTNNNPHYGPARNPWNLARIPGGSSGGSAAAVAAGLCYGSIGSDTGGSIRIPASLCGIVGLKPTLGLVSVEGTIPLSPQLDCVGPLARSTRDAALLAAAILAHRRGQVTPRSNGEKKSLNRVRLGVPKQFFLAEIAIEVRSACDEALRRLKRLGASLVEVSIPSLYETEDAGNQIAWPEATLYHQQAGWFPARAEDYGEDVRTRLEMGTKVSATSYLRALETREKFINEFHLALEEARIDALVAPTTPIAAPLIGEETTAVNGTNHPTRALLLKPNRPANLAGVPAISVPCGFTSDGLPLGLQLIGAVSGERLLLQIAGAFETAHPFSPPPSL